MLSVVIDFKPQVGERVFCEGVGREGVICATQSIYQTKHCALDELGNEVEIPNYQGIFLVKVCFAGYPRIHSYQYGEPACFFDIFLDDASPNGCRVVKLRGVK